MTKAQKLIALAVVALLLAGSLFVLREGWLQFTAAFVAAAFARAIWVAPLRE